MKNRTRYILLIIVLLFAVWNVSWYVMTSTKYNKFLEVIPENEWKLPFVKKDGYVYNVKKPAYLSFSGNLGISNDNKPEALIIWPQISGGYVFGFRVEENGQAYEIYVNENMEVVDTKDTIGTSKVEEYKPVLTELFKKANEMWGI
jgi:hypothetical protein